MNVHPLNRTVRSRRADGPQRYEDIEGNVKAQRPIMAAIGNGLRTALIVAIGSVVALTGSDPEP